ncbi:unnamed protein product [Parnassius mnemosyne]|uniref:FLYWCH-type domain-containing protein n=1 Tax=Parnassius mnemosyne TaxID=213953 RepID=A0AAV1K843_9NEOP
MIHMEGHNFSLHKSTVGPKKRWVCCKWASGCRAVIITVDDTIMKYSPVLSVSKFGKPVILYEGHRFNRHSSSKGDKAFFVCVKWTAGCRASIKIFNDEIISIKNNHNHS